mmetsp:Transcript_32226/g.81303  ORF Transcript_32226/g.81303 Transcript_32226/m.81303 type:complete len:267 (+) Transcript_32226:1536-2336(+)
MWAAMVAQATGAKAMRATPTSAALPRTTPTSQPTWATALPSATLCSRCAPSRPGAAAASTWAPPRRPRSTWTPAPSPRARPSWKRSTRRWRSLRSSTADGCLLRSATAKIGAKSAPWALQPASPRTAPRHAPSRLTEPGAQDAQARVARAARSPSPPVSTRRPVSRPCPSSPHRHLLSGSRRPASRAAGRRCLPGPLPRRRGGPRPPCPCGAWRRKAAAPSGRCATALQSSPPPRRAACTWTAPCRRLLGTSSRPVRGLRRARASR